MQYGLARTVVIAVMVTTSMWTARAGAQDRPPVTAERAPSAADRARAVFLLDRSAVAFRLGRYTDAIVLLEEAYVLSEEPILLYNIGRAYESAGDLERALGAYRRYLEVSVGAPNAAAVLETIATIEARQAELAAREAAALRAQIEAEERARAEEAARAAEEERRVRAAEERRAREERESRDLRSATAWSIAGLGAATLAGGAIAGVLALERRDDALVAPDQPTALRAMGDARDLATGANVAFAVGAALALGGVVWGAYELALGGGETSATVSLLPGALELRGTF